MKYYLGIDVGSTTVKLALINPETNELLYHRYERHGAHQAETVARLLKELYSEYPDSEYTVVMCGSGAKDLAREMGVYYLQEVVANSVAIKELFPQARVAIELGGQDAKIIFFHMEEETGQLIASDMRMNGACAGGTGAFIDEVASLLKIPVEEFNAQGEKGTHVYDISGRCGVFAKTDIQPLLNQGVSRNDLALSTFHAIAKQTIGGLAQGLEIVAPVIFEGGPLTFNPKLIDVFKERLGLSDDEVLIPDNPEIFVAYGAALSIDKMFIDEPQTFDPENALKLLAEYPDKVKQVQNKISDHYFETEEEQEAFIARHPMADIEKPQPDANNVLSVYIGIDAGSTTSKFVLLSEDEKVVDSFYMNNDGDPMGVLQKALLEMHDKYESQGIKLNILGVGSTGYGEKLIAKAFNADFHTVETVSHAHAALHYVPGTTFVLDIGGQDMKAIFVNNGIVTGIVLNEACSAGCGSFVANYAQSLKVPVQEIAERAFSASHPAHLGSRCTVFMNSSIITEQKNGKTPNDILAGLCRSIIENVFTKVIRMSNVGVLGEKVVVQGGTFKNNAVLRAMEQFTGKEVHRAPYPGEMGAIGIALLTKKHMEAKGLTESCFIGFDELKTFGYSQQSNFICTFCTNNCNRTVVTFANGSKYITGNRCERGEIIGDVKDENVKAQLKEKTKALNEIPDVFSLRHKLLFEDYKVPQVDHEKDITIGIPRVLEFWRSYPFWNALFSSLGFKVKVSSKSSMKLFESGLPFVPSDTVCFPGKIVHGHIQDLVRKKVDRIFMPIMYQLEPENKRANSNQLCAVVKGYPIIIANSDEPEERYGVQFDKPIFHWPEPKTRDKQLIDWLRTTFGIKKSVIKEAIKIADDVDRNVYATLEEEGAKLIESLEGTDKFAVVLAGRPYHSDELVNHHLARFFTQRGIPVLSLDALPDIHDMPIDLSRIETNVNFHVRMVAAAMFVAQHPNLELCQIVSFGCGHDAVLTDEIVRVMKEVSNKDPLVLKLDETDASGPLNIRVQSFVETIKEKREKVKAFDAKPIPKPFEVQWKPEDTTEKVILVPNVSEAFCKITTASIRRRGFRAEPMPMADNRAIALGKKYVHNDMCFPAQINIGEFLAALESGQFDPDKVIVGLAKHHSDCRISQYSAMARKALDDAGYPQVPIITTDSDIEKIHPGFQLGTKFEYTMMWGIVMLDVIESLRHKIAPYELNKGETYRVCDEVIDHMSTELATSVNKAVKAFKLGMERIKKIQYDRSVLKPRAFIIGEFLLNYHPTSNHDIERYLEDHGMEIIMPRFQEAFHRDYLAKKAENKKFGVSYPFMDMLVANISDQMFFMVNRKIHKIAAQHPLFEEPKNVYELAAAAEDYVPDTYLSGEGWLIPAEVITYAEKGVNSFIILQPFGCLPNHITGRGLIKAMKKKYPHIQMLSLDFDPDTSFANIENRLQMLIINAREIEAARREVSNL